MLRIKTVPPVTNDYLNTSHHVMDSEFGYSLRVNLSSNQNKNNKNSAETVEIPMEVNNSNDSLWFLVNFYSHIQAIGSVCCSIGFVLANLFPLSFSRFLSNTKDSAAGFGNLGRIKNL